MSTRPECLAAEKAASAVDHDRLQARIATLARFGGRDDGGVSRETLTDHDRAARRYLIDEALALGCQVMVDDCANLYFRRAGAADLPPVLTGSHIDTQPVGGKLDGAYGVLAGLEVIAALNDGRIQTRHPVEVVAWTNEEGCRFGPGAMGSSAFVQADRLAGFRESSDGDGIRFGDALDHALSELTDIARAPLGRALAAYLELHIEQGPVLEQAQVPLGVVTGIQGVRWYRVVCKGQAAHAGTTPMHRRGDAMITAIDIAQRLHGQATEAPVPLRVTLGRWLVQPNSINTIADQVTFSVDARSPDEGALDRFEAFLAQAINGNKALTHVEYERFFQKSPTIFDADLLAVVAQACDHVCSVTGHDAPLHLNSGAFHDAMYLAQHCPSAMIFVPSEGGISHNAAEATDPESLTLGARALAYAVTCRAAG